MITSIKIQLREWLNPLFAPYRRNKLKNNFSIISNNCWGGHVYRYFGIPYNSPTVGMYFYAEDYIRFLSNLKYYLGMNLEIITAKESVHYADLIENHKDSLDKPIGKLDDVEIIFLHYKTAEEAKEKWERRKARINWNNIIVKMSEMNGCTKEHILFFDTLPYKQKFIFTTHDYKINSQVVFKEYVGKREVQNDTAKFRKYIDLVKLVNGEPFKKNQ